MRKAVKEPNGNGALKTAEKPVQPQNKMFLIDESMKNEIRKTVLLSSIPSNMAQEIAVYLHNLKPANQGD